MKDFSKERNDSNADINLSSLPDHLIPPENIKGSSADHVNLKGTNTGATAVFHQNPTGDSSNCYNINIYVNNNVQGINNSIVLGSDIRMGAPGVHLSFRDLNLKKGSPRRNKEKKMRMIKKNMESPWFNKVQFYLFLFCMFIMFFWVSF
ncbi:hypothetical protein BVC80_9099g97 [Macleaya cordata]|uniref:Uncharacterized protein n=1 Tax=Macleaya cordata TaxID=56857 RepID=A0A200PVQ7_MACCD|nr:hypothetical protein BVC80_9099g97 [Macleaya cordata]